MNLFLRLLRVFLHAFFRSRVDVLDKAYVKFRVWPTDLDVNRHMTNSRYLSIMDLGRTDLMIRSGLGNKIYRMRLAPVLGSAYIRWRKSLSVFDVYLLETQVVGWDDKWVYILQRAICNDIVVSVALVKGLFTSRDGAVALRDIIHLIRPNLESPPLPKSVKLWIQMEEEVRSKMSSTMEEVSHVKTKR